MPNENKLLCLFTAEYPYGNKSETFLETEIEYLASQFEEVLIFPSIRNAYIRPLPNNVKIVDVCIVESSPKSKKIKLLMINIFLVCKLFFSEIGDKGLNRVIRGRSILLDYLAQQLKIRDLLLQYFKQDFSNKVFYDYWFCDKVLALSLLKEKKKNINFVSRGHRYDIYDECWTGIGIPFRAWKIKTMEQLFVISKYGQYYVKQHVAKKYANKIQLSYLGVKKYKQNIIETKSEIKTIVSCSSLLPFKNVDKIPLVLKELETPIRWLHFGDGNDRKKVEEVCKLLPISVEYKLMGHIDNIQLIEFYQQNKVDLFVSMSQSEGLPVTMMEALSFNIPIVAIPVGGIPELVINEKTGFLLPSSGDVNESAIVLKKALEFSFNKEEIEQFYQNNFNAEVNYSYFIKEICCFKN